MKTSAGCRVLALLAASLLATAAEAFEPIPKPSARALKVTRGKAFSSGAVFINGKYLPPPYVVERWGTGIRINGKQVTEQVVDWNDFLRTQKNVRTVVKELPVAAPPPAEPEEQKPEVEADVSESDLDALFGDDPPPPKPVKTVKRAEPAKPKAEVSYELDGAFVHNETTRAMVNKINARRTDIDRTLRAGGFICFGDKYSQVSGDARTLLGMLEKLPECMWQSESQSDFSARVLAANLFYLHETLRLDLYRHRREYRKLQQLRKKLKQEQELQEMIREANNSGY